MCRRSLAQRDLVGQALKHRLCQRVGIWTVVRRAG